MKDLLFGALFGLSLLSAPAFAESISVDPFALKFSLEQKHIDLKAKLNLECRYEKWVLGDSAEYVYSRKEVGLDVNVDANGAARISLSQGASLELDGWHRPTKECAGSFELSFVDKRYSIGWAGRVDAPIKFSIGEGGVFQSGDSVFDLSKLEGLLGSKSVQFSYRNQGMEGKVYMLIDDQPYGFPVSVAIDQSTGMPYRLSIK